MANALKAINKRVNALAKRHPNAKRKTLQKQAGKEWKAGKLKATRPKKKRKAVAGKRKYKVTHKVRKVGSRGNTSGNTRTATKASTSRNRTATSTKTITAHVKVGRGKKRRAPRTRTITRYKTVRGPGSKTNTLLLVGGIAAVGLLAYTLINRSSTTAAPAIQLTGNASRDNAAQNLVAYAQAANLGITAITSLINAINSWGDDSVISASTQVSSGTSSISDIAVLPPSGGPSIHLG